MKTQNLCPWCGNASITENGAHRGSLVAIEDVPSHGGHEEVYNCGLRLEWTPAQWARRDQARHRWRAATVVEGCRNFRRMKSPPRYKVYEENLMVGEGQDE